MVSYSKNHLWVKAEGDIAEIGITDYASEELGGILFVNLPDVGDAMKAGERFGDVESTKTVSDLISPVDGEVVAVREELLDDPEAISDDPFETWLIKARIEGLPDDLMGEEEYRAFLLQ